MNENRARLFYRKYLSEPDMISLYSFETFLTTKNV